MDSLFRYVKRDSAIDVMELPENCTNREKGWNSDKISTTQGSE